MHLDLVKECHGTPQAFPRPWLFGLDSGWTGDMKTAAFLAKLLDHLDIDLGPKQVQRRMFAPIGTELTPKPLVDLFGKDWQPTVAPMGLGKILTPEGAREYVTRVQRFFAGEFDAANIGAGLDSRPLP